MAMLEIYCDRAKLADGMKVCEQQQQQRPRTQAAAVVPTRLPIFLATLSADTDSAQHVVRRCRLFANRAIALQASYGEYMAHGPAQNRSYE